VRQSQIDEADSLYRRDGARLWRGILAFTGDREVANDSVAEAFAQALRRERTVRRLAPWIWRGAFRIAAGEMAGRSKFADVGVPEEAVGLRKDERFDDPSGSLMAALRKLPPMQRGALVLRYHSGYTVREGARILGSTSLTVGIRLSRGRRRLGDLMGMGRHDVKDTFRALDRIPAPDLWRRIQKRRPAEIFLGPSWRRVATAALALAAAAAGVALAVRSFG
jgi:RNA polymerase sigma-70 factor (ECF subfamily)